MDFIFNTGPFGRDLMVNASGAVIIDNGPGDFLPYAMGSTGRVVCVNSSGALKVSGSVGGGGSVTTFSAASGIVLNQVGSNLEIKERILIAKPFKSIVGASGDVTVDLAQYNNYYIPLDNDISITLANAEDGAKYTFVFEQTIGNNTVLFSGGNPVYWVGGVAYVPTAAAGSKDFVVAMYIDGLSAFLAQAGLDCF